MMYALIGLSVVLLAACCVLYCLLASRAAGGHLALFLAESFMIRNMLPESYPTFAMVKAIENKEILKWWYRPLAVWYIKRTGFNNLTMMALYLGEDLDNDERIDVKQ
jgi:hypothetical protein